MPASSTDQAQSILLSDHNLDKASLDMAAANIRAGKAPQFDEIAIDKMAKEFEEFQKLTPPGALGCRILSVILIAVPVALLIIIVALAIYTARN